jgi:hypothetical protein
MLIRWLAACAAVLSASAAGSAQAQPVPPDRPAELPPLLTPPPANPPATPPAGPPGPVGEYDHSLLYLPPYDPAAAKGPETCRPLGRWWVNPSLELAWVPTRSVPTDLRLRLPDGAGGTIPGPILPTAGQNTNNFLAGFGLSAGRFIGDAHTQAVEGSLFFTGASLTFDGFAPGMLVVFPRGAARSPAQVIVLPPPLDTTFVGVFPATLSTTFIGADANYRHNLYCSDSARLDALAGYRFAYLRDELYLGDASGGSGDAYRQNRAAVANPFHGGQIGLAGEARWDRWYAGGVAKVAFGAVTPAVSATGFFAGAEGATAAGYAPLPALANSSRTQFAVLPTVSLVVGRQVREHARVFAGYSFQYLSRVARLGDVLDPAATALVSTDFWVQAVNFGVELRY